MTNVLATNAVIPQASDVEYYLPGTQEGFPLNKQVPRTYQIYTGTGGSIAYDGSNELIISGNLLTSSLTVNLSTGLTQARNNIGRSLIIHVIGLTTQNVIVTCSIPTQIIIAGTATSVSSYTIIGGAVYKSVSVYFINTSVFVLDPGPSGVASGISVSNVGGGPGTLFRDITGNTINIKTLRQGGWMGVSNATDFVTLTNLSPVVYFTASQYPHCTSTSIGSFLTAILKDTRIYTVSNVGISPWDEGTVTVSNGPFSGPGGITVVFEYTPTPRQTKTVSVRFNLETNDGLGFIQNLLCEVSIYPNLANVRDFEYLNGTHPDGSIGMYDPLNDSGSVQYAQYEAGGNIDFVGSSLNAWTVDIQDNLAFYTLDGDNRIYWKTFTDGNSGELLNLDDLPNHWSPGAQIADIDYDEKHSILYVLPGLGTQRMPMIPILPYEWKTGIVRTADITSRPLPFSSAFVAHSIAIAQQSGHLFISYKPTIGNITVGVYWIMNVLSQINSIITGIGTDLSSIMVGSRGTLMIHFESDLSLHTLPYYVGVDNGFTFRYNLPLWMKSLSRNCYGQYQG